MLVLVIATTAWVPIGPDADEEQFPIPPPPLPVVSQAVHITAQITASRCEQYRPIVKYWQEQFPLDADLVLAVMAQESHCLRTVISNDGHHTIGLMQIAVKPWTPSEGSLHNPWVNIEWGMYMLYSAINHPEHNPYKSIRRGLAAYNCGWTSLEANRCMYFGGYTYADKVLNFWLPYIEDR